MKFYWSLYVLFLIGILNFKCLAQVSNTDFTSIPFTILKTDKDSVSIHTIINSKKDFTPINNFQTKSKPNDTYWFKLDFKNELPILQKDSLWYLRTNYFEFGSLYFLEHDKISEKPFGLFELEENMYSIHHPGISFTTGNLIDGRYLYLKVKRITFYENTKYWNVVYTSQQSNNLKTNYYSIKDYNKLISLNAFIGICSIMFLITLTLYFYFRKLEFLFYSLYTISLLIYLVGLDVSYHQVFFDNYTIVNYWFIQISQVFINLFYLLFVTHYLSTKTVYPILNKVITVVCYILIGIIILDTLFFILEFYDEHIYIMNIQRIVMTVFGLFGMLYLLFKAKTKLAYFIILGSFLYMAGALGMLFLNQRYYMITGGILEIIVFALGLTYKLQQENIEKIKIEKEASLNKVSALRAQMNPHFIFNSLSSIQHLITSNDKMAALNYLSKFSRLTRNILESSIDTNVLLKDEIKMLKDYLELESLRFDNTFKYIIKVADDINTEAIEIPFLIIQPFVENAILHGLLNKEDKDKQLSILLKKEDSFMVCEIDDNGIGRQASKSNKNIHKRHTKSRGLDVTKQRLQVMNEDKNINNIEIIDKEDKEGNSLGTKVIIKILI